MCCTVVQNTEKAKKSLLIMKCEMKSESIIIFQLAQFGEEISWLWPHN